MKSSPDIFLRNFGGSGGLSIYWAKSTSGDAVDAAKGKGVGFFSPFGELLGVEFDDVENKKDEQKLVFEDGTEVHVRVKDGKVKLTKKTPKSKSAA